MKIGGIEISQQGSTLVLNKDPGVLIKDATLLTVLIGIILLVGWFISAGREIKTPNTFALLVIALLALGVLSVIASNIIRMIKNATNYVLETKDGEILINHKPFCNQENLISVVIQASNGWDGIGVSYVIGLASTTSFSPLSFYQSLENAETIAEELAVFLATTVVMKKSKSFSLFKGY